MSEINKDNLAVYNRVAKPPKEALKTIGAGRLKGMSDINPMWRIKALTQEFGMAGFGWKIENVRFWAEHTDHEKDTGIAAFCEMDMKVKVDGEWSEPIHGIGGSQLLARESSGLHLDDECYKKAYTDAMSVCCKALGFGGAIYWSTDSTKYGVWTDGNTENAPQEPTSPKNTPVPMNATNSKPQERRGLKAAVEAQSGWRFTEAYSAFIAKHGIDGGTFAMLRNSAIASGLAEDISSADMTKEKAEQLFKIIEDNFIEE